MAAEIHYKLKRYKESQQLLAGLEGDLINAPEHARYLHEVKLLWCKILRKVGETERLQALLAELSDMAASAADVDRKLALQVETAQLYLKMQKFNESLQQIVRVNQVINFTLRKSGFMQQIQARSLLIKGFLCAAKNPKEAIFCFQNGSAIAENFQINKGIALWKFYEGLSIAYKS